MQSVLKPQYICRKTYIERAFHYVGHPVIKVLTGQRRTGKSYLLWQMMDAIKQKSPKSNIVFVSKELYEFDAIRDYHDLVAFAKKNLKQKVDNFLFIDEVQEIAQFEKAIRSLLAEGRYDIWCSGSNASLLSGDLATLLGGRTMEIRVSGLSYAEFIEFHKLTDSKDTLDKFLKFGGLPYLRNLQLDDDIVYDYLRSIYASILYKDVVARHQLRNIIFLENLVRYAASCTGSLLSAKKISDYLKSQKASISPSVVLNYLLFLNDAYFLHKVSRTEIRGKKVFEVGEKYYFEDVGLRNSIIGYKQNDINGIIENTVYNQLTRQGFDTKVGKLGDKEIDFVCVRHDETVYVQVAYLIPDKKTHDREFGNLLSIDDNCPKYVVSMDETAGGHYMGIRHLHLKKFLTTDLTEK